MGPRSGNGARPPGGPLPVMRRLHDTVAVCALLCVLATAPAAFGAPASPAAATVPPAEAPQKAPPAPGTPLEAAAPQAPVSIPLPQIVAKAEEVRKLLRELDALAAPAPAITAEEFRLRSGGDVVALCATPAADPLYAAAVHMCHGFGADTYQTIMALTRHEKLTPSDCSVG